MLQGSQKGFCWGLIALTSVACGGSSGSLTATSLAPLDPASVVRGFMDAVKAENLTTMSGLWGTSSGLAADRMDREELVRRLTVIMTYLAHDEYSLTDDDEVLLQATDRRIINIRLRHNGCLSEIPFTVVRSGRGWLVQNMDLGAIGNPQRVCPAGP